MKNKENRTQNTAIVYIDNQRDFTTTTKNDYTLNDKQQDND